MSNQISSWIFESSILRVIIVLTFLGHILRERKPPTSTTAWLLLLIFQPYIGVLLYLLFGSRKFSIDKPLINEALKHKSGVAENTIQNILINSGSPPACHAEKIIFIKNGMEAYHSLIDLIRNATSSIFIETYIFKNDFVGRMILAELTHKARQGLDIRVLLDSLGAHLPGHPSFDDFKKAGGKFQMFLPLYKRPNLRNHRKQIIIDHRIAMIGGMNIGSEYMGPSENKKEWLDLAVIIHGQLSVQLEKVFAYDWSFSTGRIKSESELSAIKDEGDVFGQVVNSGPDVLSDPIYELFLTTFYQARHRIWITTPYFIPDESLAKAIELAAKRNIDVRLCIPQKSNHFLADLGRRTYLQQLYNSGVKIYFYPRMLHAKTTLVDSEYCFIGSANMDARSLLLNYEIGLSLYDVTSIQELENWNTSIILKSNTEFNKLTRAEEFIGGIARLFSPLM